MDVLFVLIPLSLVMATLAVLACLHSIKSGQFEHLEEKKWTILTDTSTEISKNKSSQG